MCFSKRVRASDALILSLSSFRDIVQAVFALSASSSYLRLLGQDILASAEDCIPPKHPLPSSPLASPVLSRITRAPIPDQPLPPVPVRSRPFRPFLRQLLCYTSALGGTEMANFSGVIKQLKEERDRVEQQLSGLNAALAAFASAYSGTKPSRKRRKMSAKARAKIAAAQRARWAKVRAKRRS